MINSDNIEYYSFSLPQRLDKAMHTLEGIMMGLSFDNKVDEKEVRFLKDWLEDNAKYAEFHPFNEVYPVIKEALADGIIDEDEKQAA